MTTPNAAPLDLDSFAGFTPGPWTLQMGDEQNPFNGIVRDSKGHILVKRATMNYEDGRDMALLAAAPALLSECKRLRAENERLLRIVQIAYAILAPIRHQWSGRHTVEGQSALAAMRDAIADSTGRDAEEVQDEYAALEPQS